MIIKDVTKMEFLKNIRDKKVVVFGSGAVGREAVKNLNLENQTAFICDNDPNKQGKAVLLSGRKYEIRSADALKDLPACEYCILIASARYYKDILNQLEKLDELKDLECYVYSWFAAAIKKGTDDFFEERTVTPILMQYEKVLNYFKIPKEEQKEKIEEKRRELWKRDENGVRPVIVPRIVFRLTTECTLRCQGCGALISYFKEQYTVPTETVLEDIQAFLRGIDECIIAEITGGETLLHQGAAECIRLLAASDKVDCVSFATNGTVMPSDEVLKACQNKKVVVRISDYGILGKTGNVVECFEKAGIYPVVMTDFEWLDFGGIEERGRESSEIRERYVRCTYSCENKTVSYGKMFACGRAETFFNRKLDTSRCNYIELNADYSVEDQRALIRQLFDADYCTICNYCDFGGIEIHTIPAGVQNSQIHQKSEYTIISRTEYQNLLRQLENQSFIQEAVL